jgi:hypothetical protein
MTPKSCSLAHVRISPCGARRLREARFHGVQPTCRPDFDPTQVEREAVGSATLRFADCDQGEFSFTAFEQSLTLPVQRLAHTMGMPCESRNGVPGRDSTEYAGQSGSWFDPGHIGEGYALQWMNPHSALLTWYSYDGDGEQYWMLGVGQLDDPGRLHFPQLHAPPLPR